MIKYIKGIVLKKRAVIQEDKDFYLNSEIDEEEAPVWAKLTPIEGQWWINPEAHPEKWNFYVNPEGLPEWFDCSLHETIFRGAVCQWWKSHVLEGQEIEELNTGLYWLEGCKVKRLCGDARVRLHSSRIDVMDENSWAEGSAGEFPE